MLDDNTYRVYDNTVSFIIQNVLKRAENSGSIGLVHFEPRDKDHLTVLYAALYAGSLTGRKIALNIDLLPYIKFRLTHRNMRKWYCRTGGETRINVPAMIDSIFKEVEGANIMMNGIGCVYDEYYAPRKDGE